MDIASLLIDILLMRSHLKNLHGTIFLANGHQAGHLILSDDNLFAAKFGEADVS